MSVRCRTIATCGDTATLRSSSAFSINFNARACTSTRTSSNRCSSRPRTRTKTLRPCWSGSRTLLAPCCWLRAWTFLRNRFWMPPPGIGGEFVDLDAERTVEADDFHIARGQLSERLTSLGLEPADRVVISVSNGPQFVRRSVSVLAVGGSPLLVHPRTPAAELKRTALKFGAGLVLSDECPLADLAAEELPTAALSAGDWLQLGAAKVRTRSPASARSMASLPGCRCIQRQERPAYRRWPFALVSRPLKKPDTTSKPLVSRPTTRSWPSRRCAMPTPTACA